MKTMTYCRIVKLTTFCAAVTACSALFAERQPYERYQSVVDRQMFGQPPPGFDPTKPPSEVSAKEEREKEQELTKEQEQVKSAIHFSMVNVTPAGDTAVGFTDNSDSKNPKHYYLKVGESRDGWTVKEADALKATMTIAKGEIEVSLELGGNSASGGSTARSGGGAAPRTGLNAFGGRPPMPGSRLGNGANGGGASRGLGSLRERRMLREQQRAEDAKAAAEKEAQREQERAAEKARQEQEKADREKEREEQRAQLMQIQEELRKAREERAKAEAKQKEQGEEEPPKEGSN